MSAYLVFGRDKDGELPWSCWWPLFVEDGPHQGATAEHVLGVIQERLELGGEDHYDALVAVPVETWRIRKLEEGAA